MYRLMLKIKESTSLNIVLDNWRYAYAYKYGRALSLSACTDRSSDTRNDPKSQNKILSYLIQFIKFSLEEEEEEKEEECRHRHKQSKNLAYGRHHADSSTDTFFSPGVAIGLVAFFFGPPPLNFFFGPPHFFFLFFFFP